MGLYIMGSGREMIDMAMGSKYGPMGPGVMAIGLIIKCMEKANFISKMEIITKVNGLKIDFMEEVLL